MKQDRAQRALDELLAHSGKTFQSIEELERTPWMRRRLEIERNLHRSPTQYQLECLVKGLKPTLDRLAEFAESYQPRALAPNAGTTTKTTLHYARKSRSDSMLKATPRQRRIFDLESRLGRAATWEVALAISEQIDDLWRQAKATESRLKRQYESMRTEGLDKLSEKKADAVLFILTLLSHGERRWPEVERLGIEAGHAKKTLRNAQDWLRHKQRVELAASHAWRLVPEVHQASDLERPISGRPSRQPRPYRILTP